MKITFLGTGTSQGVPMIACHCEVCQSSDAKDKRLRSSILIDIDGKHIVVDTGPDFRYQMLREQVETLDAVLFTHSHKDHIAGLDDVRAFNFFERKSIPIYATEVTQEALKRDFYYAFSDFKYPGVPQLELNTIQDGSAFELFEKEIVPVEVLHYKMPVLGFRIDKFAYITDAKTFSPQSIEALSGLDVLVINALQRESHISHLTLSEALDMVALLQPKKAYFTHVGHRLGKHELVSKELPAHVFLAYDGLQIDI